MEKWSCISRNLVQTMKSFHIVRYYWEVAEFSLPMTILHHEFLMTKTMTKEKEGKSMSYNNAVTVFI